MTEPTRRDREIALKAMSKGFAEAPGDKRWLITGDPEFEPLQRESRLYRVAQALADARAEAEHRAWNEGYLAGVFDEVERENPYPRPVK